MDNLPYHIPALLPQCIEALNINPQGVYVDVTYGGGGHSRAIVENLSPNGHLYSFDQDTDAVTRAFADPRFTIILGNFRFIKNFLRFNGVDKVDGILGDLGVSFHHFDDAERGFSFRADAPLDMRMNRKAPRTAAEIIATYSETRLADILFTFGELKNSRKIAAAICRSRQQSPILTTTQLLAAIAPCINPRQEKKELAQVFQALRIEVNGELDALIALLNSSLTLLNPSGRLAIITYHSLEDRLVKNFMRTGNIQGNDARDFYGRNLSPFRMLTSKPIVPSAEEIERNPRSRSAKLRVAEYIPIDIQKQ